jgi:RNA polymerase sigma factor (sigma-70 family)
LDEIIEELEDSVSVLSDPTQDIELSSEGRFFIEKINNLETSDKQVVYMRFVDDLKPKEIAEILNLSPNVVSVRLNRAIERLREIAGINLQDNE